MNNWRIFAVIGSMVLLVLTCGFVEQAAAQLGDAERNRQVKEVIDKLQKEKDDREKERIKAGRAQVDGVLLELERVYKAKGKEEARKFAGQRRLEIKEGDMITVYIRLKPGISAAQFDRTKFQAHGGKVIDSSTELSITELVADIPIGLVSKIAEIKDISDIILPSRIELES